MRAVQQQLDSPLSYKKCLAYGGRFFGNVRQNPSSPPLLLIGALTEGQNNLRGDNTYVYRLNVGGSALDRQIFDKQKRF